MQAAQVVVCFTHAGRQLQLHRPYRQYCTLSDMPAHTISCIAHMAQTALFLAHADNCTDRQTDRQTDRNMDGWMDMQTDVQTYIHANIEADIQPGRRLRLSVCVCRTDIWGGQECDPDCCACSELHGPSQLLRCHHSEPFSDAHLQCHAALPHCKIG